MRAAHISSALEDIPVDFFADPDGCWEYDELVQVAGFDQAWGQLSIGALTEPYSGFPDGAAVVLFSSADECAVALVDCLASELQLARPQLTSPQLGAALGAANDDRRELGRSAWNEVGSMVQQQPAQGSAGRVPSSRALEERNDVAA